MKIIIFVKIIAQHKIANIATKITQHIIIALRNLKYIIKMSK